MLSKKYRFHSRGGVRYVYQKGKTIRSPKMSLIYTNNSKGFTRVAVVVSKKIEKSAVKRNRIRRRVYECIRKNFDLFPKEKDYIFVIFSNDTLKMNYSDLEKNLGDLVEQSKM